ncbi:hypothetical protein VE03_07702 [Pseudogymnoascus sp. 23342-1-I1]|nr:hypothetical protein VE03_07702 [Pseudogymnoascus sp. 23342-1-I1]
MKLHLLTAFLVAFLPIANGCLSIVVEWNPRTNMVTGSARDNGVIYCTMNQRKYAKQLWFTCLPGYAAYITRDFKLFAWHAHDADYRIDAYHGENLAGNQLRWANSFGCNCGGWKCGFPKEFDRSDP